MHAFIVIMTNKFGTLMVQIPSVTTVKLEPSDNCIFILSSFDEYVCPTVDIFDTSPFQFRSTTPSTSKFYADVQ